MDGRNFLEAYDELHSAREQNEKSFTEWATRELTTFAEGLAVGAICSFGFLFCMAAVVGGTAVGTLALAAEDKYLFGHEVGWRADIVEAGVTALASSAMTGICNAVWKQACLKALGFSKLSQTSTWQLSKTSLRVALIWATVDTEAFVAKWEFAH